MQATGDDTLLDLCSGGGGPALTIAGLLREQYATPLRVVLTDLYPNLPRLERARAEGRGKVEFRDRPVDATAVPESLAGFRLICNAFHHLPPSAARKCLADAVSQRRGIALVEMVDRSAASLFGVTVGTSAMLAVTPFIRPCARVALAAHLFAAGGAAVHLVGRHGVVLARVHSGGAHALGRFAPGERLSVGHRPLAGAQFADQLGVFDRPATRPTAR